MKTLEKEFFRWLKSQKGTHPETAALLGISSNQVQSLVSGQRRPGRLALCGWYEIPGKGRTHEA